jgi:adenylosuccinate lyase
MDAGRVVKVEGGENDLIDRISSDEAFGMTKEEILSVMKPENYIGRADKQVTEFLENEIYPILKENEALLGIKVEINV